MGIEANCWGCISNDDMLFFWIYGSRKNSGGYGKGRQKDVCMIVYRNKKIYTCDLTIMLYLQELEAKKEERMRKRTKKEQGL